MIAGEFGARFPVRGAVFTAYLEQIGKVGCESERQPHVQCGIAEISHQQPLIACAAPDEFCPVQVQLLAAQCDLAIDQQVRIAEVGAEDRVVILRHRTQQERACILEQQLELRQDAGIAMVETFRIAEFAANVAALIEHGERVAVLERAGPPLLQIGAG